jgi:hypothetical protein
VANGAVKTVRSIDAELATIALEICQSTAALIFDSTDVNVLSDCLAIKAAVDRLEVLIVATLRADNISWDMIAQTLGVTRQSAHRRLRKDADDAIGRLNRLDAEEHGKEKAIQYRKALNKLDESLSSLRGLEISVEPARKTKAQ